MKLLAKYKNGNTDVVLYDNGTRILETQDDEFEFDFPLNIDVTITNQCDGGCPFCYMNCTPTGKHAELNQSWIKTLHRGTEIAINGNTLSHTQLISFLQQLKDQGVIANMTVNQKHFEKYYQFIQLLRKNELIHGVGVSLVKPSEQFIKMIKAVPNSIIHVINGIFTEDDYNMLKDNGLKILILGYKHLRRGETYYKDTEPLIVKNQNWVNDHIKEMTEHFNVISFDNLALKQIPVKELLSDQEWDLFYGGDDGTMSMFIDMVSGQFAMSSTTQLETFTGLLDSVDEMFKIVKKTHDEKYTN